MCEAAITPWAASDAFADFRRARRRHRAAGAWRRLTRRATDPDRPRDLGHVAALIQGRARLRSIPLEAIVGTVDATADFDADFRPTTDRISTRWQGIARAYRSGRPLPPIAVIEQADGFYVLDGRHRVSVARALGHDAVDAWATPTPTPTRPFAARRDAPAERPRPRRQFLRPTNQSEDGCVHFHAGDGGRPYVCEKRRCCSPRLDTAPPEPAGIAVCA